MTRFPRGKSGTVAGVAVLLVIQFLCASVFILDIFTTSANVLTLTLGWRGRELIEIGAAIGLLLGLIMGAFTLLRLLRQRNRAQESLRRASGAFHRMLEECFDHWRLTDAERDVALFLIKGMSTAEIARLRDTSEGTVKSQSNAIYRKAGVTGRPQLLSLFIDDLINARTAGTPRPRPPTEDQTVTDTVET